MIEQLLGIGPARKAIWKIWYRFLTRRLRGEDVVFLNYAFESDPPSAIPLSAADEPNRACIQLYHHVASQTDLRGKSVLEVSCGHGGGASYVTRTLDPARYTALDLNTDGIRHCRRLHPIDKLEFVAGDAGKLPFPDATFDVLLNVEASHCYPDFPRFLRETARVLKPGGHFLYTDFRFAPDIPAWENALADAPLELVASRDISQDVRRGMERNSARSQELLDRKLPKFLHGLGRDFAGVAGSRVHRAIQQGELLYRSFHYRRP